MLQLRAGVADLLVVVIWHIPFCQPGLALTVLDGGSACIRSLARKNLHLYENEANHEGARLIQKDLPSEKRRECRPGSITLITGLRGYEM